MEEGKKTRLYWYHDHPCRVKEIQAQKNDHDAAWVEGEEAEAICNNADYICVSAYVSKGTNYWAVQPGRQKTGESFRIDLSSEGYEKYANLAKNLEERSGDEGLTILVC